MLPEEADAALLLDMLTAARAITTYAQGRTWQDFQRDHMMRDAVERRVEVMGEAARGVSRSFQAAHPAIPWAQLVAQRNALAHEDGAVVDEVIWSIASEHALRIAALLEPLIPPLPED